MNKEMLNLMTRTNMYSYVEIVDSMDCIFVRFKNILFLLTYVLWTLSLLSGIKVYYIIVSIR